MAINATVNVNAPIPASPSGTVYIKGDPGPPGPQGPTGPAGQDGQDGYSPTITSVPIIDGHRLTIIDAEGVKTVDVMDGEPGQDGQAGTSAGFGTPSATVDSGTGTPGVTVTASGPDTAKVFSFAFSNLKGATGQDGPAGQDGPMGPPGLEVSNSTPVSNVLAWIDPDEDTEILVPEMHTTGTPNVLDMGSEYLDAAAVYDRTQGKTQAEINAIPVVDQTPGNTVRIGCVFLSGVGMYDQVRFFVPFPFLTQNTNYSISNTSLEITNVGVTTMNIYFKTESGFGAYASLQGAGGAFCIASAYADITFA